MQVRPIRGATGADITEKTLQGTLDQLGIDRNIRDLTFAEKRLTMVISLSKQLKVSQGDYGRTIESVNNQIRIMGEQWQRVTRAVGNVFYPVLQAILPYINAILMVIVEIAKVISGLLGFKMPEFDYSGLSGTGDAANDLIEGMDGATESAEKLKSGLRGFDKLNNITTPSSDDSSVGGGAIDSRLQDAFNASFEKYNDMLDSVKTKASSIRDTVMEWLGFTKLIDEETGKVIFKFEGIAGVDLTNVIQSFKNLTDALIPFGMIVVTNVDWFIKNILFPLSKYTVENIIPTFLDLITASITALTPIIDSFTQGAQWLLDKFLIPIGLWTFGVVLDFIKLLTEDLNIFSKWAEKNQGAVSLMTNTLLSFFTGIVGFYTAGKVIAFLKLLPSLFLALAGKLAIMNVPLLVTYAGFLLLSGAILSVAQNWGKMNGFEKTISVLGLLAVAATVAAVAVGALQSAWSLGLAAIGIAAGVVAITASINSANKRAKNESAAITKTISGGAGRFADGGLPPVGQMFIANEKGAELVGQIGGKTFVANQSQMMDMIDKKLSSAGSNDNQTINIYLDENNKLGTYTLKQLNAMAKSNGKPITIGG